MNMENWKKLSFFEQLSNVDGAVSHLITSREAYLRGDAKEDYSEFYLGKIKHLIHLIFVDPKNRPKAYRIIELMDEVEEIRRYLRGEVEAEYISRYWNQYTNAINHRKNLGIDK